MQQVLQAHSEGSSLRGISRITGLAYNTVVSIVRSARPGGDPEAQLVHNDQVEQVTTVEVSADEMWGHLDVLSISTSRSPQKSRSNVSSVN